MNIDDRITVDPQIRSGKPCIKGTRITVYDVLEYLAGGNSEAELLEDFPDLSHEDVLAVLAFAAARERRLAASAAWDAGHQRLIGNALAQGAGLQ